jgi:hypothetical protein
MIQLPVILYLTILGVVYLRTYSPFEDKLNENLDILNEVTTVVLIDICYLFTDVWPDPKGQYNIGYAFIITMTCCIFTHLFFLMKSVFGDLKVRMRRGMARRNKSRAVASLLKSIVCGISEP